MPPTYPGCALSSVAEKGTAIFVVPPQYGGGLLQFPFPIFHEMSHSLRPEPSGMLRLTGVLQMPALKLNVAPPLPPQPGPETFTFAVPCSGVRAPKSICAVTPKVQPAFHWK